MNVAYLVRVAGVLAVRDMPVLDQQLYDTVAFDYLRERKRNTRKRKLCVRMAAIEWTRAPVRRK